MSLVNEKISNTKQHILVNPNVVWGAGVLFELFKKTEAMSSE